MRAVGLMSALALNAAALPALCEEVGDPVRGKAYAEKVCAECHAVLAHQDASPLFGAPPFRAVANTPGMTGTALAVWLQSPHPSMPNLLIEINDRDDVIAYILTLKEGKQ